MPVYVNRRHNIDVAMSERLKATADKLILSCFPSSTDEVLKERGESS